jgi:putative oxidoreductase
MVQADTQRRLAMLRFFDTDGSRTLFFQRLVLAVLGFAHGGQKLFGLWGGYGYAGTMGWFTETMGVPAPLALLVILVETAGMVALAAGFLTRLVSAGFALTMVGAIVLMHGQHGFYMNWGGDLGGEGYEYHLALIVLSLTLAVRGAGAWSLDGLIARRSRTPQPAIAVA